MVRFISVLLLAALATGAPAGEHREAPASKRYALVIGNSDYAAVPDLPNAHADGRIVAEFLRAQGYIVHHREDSTKRGF